MSRKIPYIRVAVLLTLLAVGCPARATSDVRILVGQVLDHDNSPLLGISIVVGLHEQVITATATDEDGRFRLRIPVIEEGRFAVVASAVGHITDTTIVFLKNDTTAVQFRLAQKIVNIGQIKVKPELRESTTYQTVDSRQIEHRSKGSLVSNNPVSAIRQPQLAHQGSNYSSKLRISGTIPNCYLNNVPIGSDPNHYGMFSIIPGSVVEKIHFYPHGTPVDFELPASLELFTPTPFAKHFDAQLDLSLVQTTGTISAGTDAFFTFASVRKSVLDKLVQQFDVHSNRRTLPPTNFQDIYVSSGVKLRGHSRLVVDQYYTRDYLSYDSGPTTNNKRGVHTFQRTDNRFLSVRLSALRRNLLLEAAFSRKNSREAYSASPMDITPQNLNINLSEDSHTNTAKVEADLFLGKCEIKLGNVLEYISARKTEMDQSNWNFLPPDASSDRPFLYQPELNQLYGSFSGHATEFNTAGYFSVGYHSGRLALQSGVRIQSYENLSDGNQLLYRNRITFSFSEKNKLGLFGGTFAENPVKRILEPYQVLIRSALRSLQPVKTRLVSATYSHRGFSLGAFAKQIRNLPIPTPDFTRVSPEGAVEDGFIRVQSSGELRVFGGDISVEYDNILGSRASLYGFYGCSHAVKCANGIATPYELNAPHRFFAEISYQFSKVVAVGSALAVRSGYPYTPTLTSGEYTRRQRYSEDYYTGMAGMENSARFPTNAAVNLFADFDFGHAELYLNVTNATNRGNPIINTSDGFVYDTAILPSVGFRWRF